MEMSIIMRPQFHTLTISDVRRETADAISVRFAVPQALREAYRFQPGQFLTLKTHIEGQEVRRSYSVCVGAHDYLRDSELRVAIKAVAGGVFSNHANRAFTRGQRMEVMTPDGRFTTPLDAAHSKHYVGFAGGSGITPVLSLIKSVLEAEPSSRFTLLYGNRAIDSIIFAEELEGLKNRYLSRFRLYHVISDEPQEVALFAGLLDQAKVAHFLENLIPPSTIDAAFICGPAPMMDAAEAALKAAGVPQEKINIERFGTPPTIAPKPVTNLLGSDPNKSVTSAAKVTVIADGKQRVLNVGYEGDAILDAALKSGADLPYACKGGVCCTCRAKVLEGEVRMDKNYTLEAKEIAQGYVLTCQAHPLTPNVVVSFDER
jgi:ring-1,2-phenylacetyl-CoA epoxidase subunit PaaE